MLACNCLNVIIETKTNDFVKVNADSLSLSEEEKNDPFFKQEIQQVGKLVNINKIHSGLIQTRIAGSWVIHYCINCDVHSHAIHREKGASFVLVNSKLLPTEVILSLRSSKWFSKLFNIIVDPNETDSDNSLINTYLPNEVEITVRGLKQIASEVLRKESLAVDERIKKFTEEMYNDLDALRDRAFREQEALTRIILNNHLSNTNKPESTKTGTSQSPENPSNLQEAQINEIIKSSPNRPKQRLTPKRQKSCPGAQITSFDAEGLFEFDGLDDIKVSDDYDLDESDVDDSINKQEFTKMTRSQSLGANLIAKSLPMNIPAFMSQGRNHFNDDIDDLPREETLDIAASIRELTRSVHGDEIFGDLPRPRFTTQI